MSGGVYDSYIVRAELEAFDWRRADWRPDRLLAASPFRNENRPSFYVYLEDTATAKAGSWGDSGAFDPEYQRGGFVKLLAYLRNESYEETAQYLADKYGIYDDEGAQESDPRPPTLRALRKIKLAPSTVPKVAALSESLLNQYRNSHLYLSQRGISPAVQRYMGVGYCADKDAITIPWRNPDGSLANIMYRSVADKTFWYQRGGRRIGELVYGIDIAYKRNLKRAVIVEAPICAMSVMTAGHYAIAVGGTAFTREKAELILRSPIEEIVIMADRDAAGQKLKRAIVEALRGKISVSIAGFPYRHKDPNDVLRGEGAEKLADYIANAKSLTSLLRREL